MQKNTNIYFDNAATTPLNQEVAELIHQTLVNSYGNPSSIHATGRQAKGLIEEARVNIAKHLGCSASEIYFSSGGTESDNLALRKGVHCLGVKHIITSPIEHHAVLSTAEEVAELHEDVSLHLLDVDAKGNYQLDQLRDLLEKHSNVFVSLMHANNELGNLADLDAIGKLCHEHNAYFHTDAVQTVGYFPFNLSESPIDMLSASAHKFNGPKGVGFIYIRKGIDVKALITGGGQERSLRAGTENVPFIVGMAKALSLCYEQLKEKSGHIKGIKSYFVERIKETIPGVHFNGNTENSHYTVVSVSLPIQMAADMFLFNLDLMGVSASGGSACSSGASKGSHVLTAIGPPEYATNVRFSFGVLNTKEAVDRCMEQLGELVSQQQAS